MKLSIVEKIGFGAGDMAINVVIIAMQLLLAYFYTDIYGLSAADVGVLFVVVRMIDAIIDPAMGVLTDKLNTRWGRYRPWLLWFAIPFGFAVYLMFITPDMAYMAKLAWAYGTYILMTLVYTAITIPYISMIGVITSDPRRTVKRQRLSLCDDQDCRFSGDYRRTDACRLAGAGQQGAGLPVFDGADGGDGRLAVYLLFSYHA
ncbi:putative membrane protein [Salmonella enterica subsp. enterica]|nr:putative membrane protein [Salmonella enterica subsp. enterica]